MKITAWSVLGIGEIIPGDQLGDIIVEACRTKPNGPLLNGDVLVVTQKIVSKAEGRLVAIDPDDETEAPRTNSMTVKESVKVSFKFDLPLGNRTLSLDACQLTE
jgi:F420-0:gamma-glutamyl ligase